MPNARMTLPRFRELLRHITRITKPTRQELLPLAPGTAAARHVFRQTEPTWSGLRMMPIRRIRTLILLTRTVSITTCSPVLRTAKMTRARVLATTDIIALLPGQSPVLPRQTAEGAGGAFMYWEVQMRCRFLPTRLYRSLLQGL